MKICLIMEGCYPYVAGGVSSWIQMLIEGMPQHEFALFAIGAEKKNRGNYKYEIPSNVSEIKEVFLDELMTDKRSKKNKCILNKEEKTQFKNILTGDHVEWDIIFNVFKKYEYFDVNEFLMSRDFIEIVEDISLNEYKDAPFTETFWTIRSMFVPILEILNAKPPEADIYHCVSTGYAGIVGAKFKFDTGKKLIITEHGIYSREREEEILKSDWVKNCLKKTWINFFKGLSEVSYEYADIITSLFTIAKNTQIELGADEKKCVTIPNGINIERFSGIDEIDTNRKEFVVGAILRVVPIKDVKTLIYSFEIVKRRMPKAKLYIIGPYDEDPEYYKECLEIIEQTGCSDIEFVGRVNIEDWMYKLDLVILTSVSEGQPFVLLEAMSAKRPVMATDVGSCREVIEGNDDGYGKCGIVVPVMNPNLIARQIIKLGNDRKLMKSMGEIGYKRVKDFYRQDDFLNRYENIYRRVNT
ncbi:MAG: GT4 family glycosyltransferase PelF [Clostridium sp.]